MVYNFRDKTGQDIFKSNTSSTEDFSRCFMTEKAVDLQASDLMKLLITHCNRAKIRIRSKIIKKSAASELIERRNKLIKSKHEDSTEVQKLTTNIAEMLAEESKSKAYKFRKYCDNDKTMNVTEMWKMKKKLWPKKKNALPMAKRNHQGKLVSAPSDLKKLLLKEYKERLRVRSCHPKMKITQRIRNKVINLKIKMAMRKKSLSFRMDQFEEVLKGLSSGRARDASGISREIFQPSNIGSGFIASFVQQG